MRYALRNQSKIASVLGEEFLNKHILNSLDNLFISEDDDKIVGRIEKAAFMSQSGTAYDVLAIRDIAEEGTALRFAVIDKTYDVLKLAFIG